MKHLILIPLIFVVFACATTKQSTENKPSKAVGFKLLYSSEYSGRDSEFSAVMNNQAEVDHLYLSIENAEAPKIDFSKSQVVALYLGTRNTGGYSVTIEKIEEADGKIVVYKREGKPSGGMVTTAFTSPIVIAEIFSTKEIIFK